MRKGKDTPQFQAPLMSAFRDAFEHRDAKEHSAKIVDGERVIEGRQALQRRGDEVALKRDLSIDLVNLLNTIDFASVVDIRQLSYVNNSVLNYGLTDVTHLTSDEVGVNDIRDQLLRALKNHEPRINPESITVEKQILRDDINQKVRFAVAGEMFFSPVDVAVDFVAELEISSGKMALTRLPTQA
jgi:type VI secretion system protein ImpF